MAEAEAAGQISETWCVVSRHYGSARRDVREVQTGRLHRPRMDGRPRVTTKRIQKKTQKPVIMEDYKGLLSGVVSLTEEA